MSILVSGSFAYDYIMDFPDSFKNHILTDQVHILNVFFAVNQLTKGYGGTAANITYTMKLLGADPIPVSAVGKDAEEYVNRFTTKGISTAGIVLDSKKLTASAYIITDKDDNQIGSFYEGPLERAEEIVFKKITPRPSLALVSPTPKRVMINHSIQCTELGIPVVFDPGQQISAYSGEELKSMIARSNFVVGNDYEIKLLQDKTGWDAKKILEHAETMITTLGEKGSVLCTSAGETIEVPACKPLSIDDPTGAGDAFRAGFFVAYEKNLPLKDCAEAGSVAASFAIENYGTQAHAFTKKEFADRYRKTYKRDIAL